MKINKDKKKPVITFTMEGKEFLVIDKENGKLRFTYDAENIEDAAKRLVAFAETLIEKGYELEEGEEGNFIVTFPPKKPEEGDHDE